MYMYVHVHVCTCTYMYMYVYVHVAFGPEPFLALAIDFALGWILAPKKYPRLYSLWT